MEQRGLVGSWLTMTSVQPEPPGTWVTCFVSELKPAWAGEGSSASVCWASLSGRPAWEIHINIDCLLSHLGRGERGQAGEPHQSALEDRAPGLKAGRGPLGLLPVGEAGLIGGHLAGWYTRNSEECSPRVLTPGERGACQQREQGDLWGHS